MEEAYRLVKEKLQTWLEMAIQMLPNFLVAVLVVVFFAFLARIATKLIRRSFRKFTENHTLFRVMTTGIYLAVLATGVLIALSILKLTTALTSLLAGAGIIGLALGFAFQDIAANVMAGIILSVRKTIRIGDIIELQDYDGVVTEIGLRATRLLTFTGQKVLVPNKEIFQNFLTNYSEEGVRRVDVSVGVTYDTDLEMASRVAKEAVSQLDFLLPGKQIDVLWKECGDSSINCTVNFWISYRRNFDYTNAYSEGMKAIKKAFDKHGITIPFPIRTLYLAQETIDQLPQAIKRS